MGRVAAKSLDQFINKLDQFLDKQGKKKIFFYSGLSACLPRNRLRKVGAATQQVLFKKQAKGRGYFGEIIFKLQYIFFNTIVFCFDSYL
jgi:hypothetical protein